MLVFELRMQYFGETFQGLFETYKKFEWSKITEFERKVDLQSHPFCGYVLKINFSKS